MKSTMHRLDELGLCYGEFAFDTALAAYDLNPSQSDYPVSKLATNFLSTTVDDGDAAACAEALWNLKPILEEELENEEGSMQRQIADEGDTPEESLLREEQKSELLQALENLSEEHKAAIILRDVKGFSYEEIAEILEVSLGTVKSRISRGRNQLKNEILKMREQNEKIVRHKKGKEGRP